MFAAHDQENLVAMHQTAATTKQQNARTLQPKTPGARFPKTPLKIPLNDENVARGAGGKSILTNKTKADRPQFVTPGEPRTGRPVLGNKTTNAKARLIQPTASKTPAARELDGRSQLRPTTTSRPKSSAPKADSSKLQILLDNTDPLSGDVDTNPAPPPEQPYESDVFPAGALTFDAARPENRMKGYYGYYHNRRDENGMTRVDREMKAKQERRFREADARIRRDMDEVTWDLGLESPKKQSILAPQDVNNTVVRPGATSKTAPSTLNARRAASALGMVPKPSTATVTQRRPLSSAKPAGSDRSLPSFMQPTKARQQPTSTATSILASRPKAATAASASSSSSTAAGVAASRSTLGYTKGRSASSVLYSRRQPEVPAAVRSLARSESTASDRTITPASYTRDTMEAKPDFVSIFDVPLEEDDADLFGPAGDEALFGDEESLRSLDDDEEEAFRLEWEL